MRNSCAGLLRGIIRPLFGLGLKRKARGLGGVCNGGGHSAFDQRDGYIWMTASSFLARSQSARPDPCAALRQRRVRRRASLRRRNLQAHRAYRASARSGRDPRFRDTVYRRGDRSGLPGMIAANKLSDCYVRPIAWRGSEQMGVSAQATKIHLAIAAWDWGSYFDPEQRRRAFASRIAQYRRPDPRDGPGKSQGGRPLHDLHHREASRRAGGLCRRADARLARASRGDARAPTFSSSRTA